MKTIIKFIYKSFSPIISSLKSLFYSITIIIKNNLNTKKKKIKEEIITCWGFYMILVILTCIFMIYIKHTPDKEQIGVFDFLLYVLPRLTWWYLTQKLLKNKIKVHNMVIVNQKIIKWLFLFLLLISIFFGYNTVINIIWLVWALIKILIVLLKICFYLVAFILEKLIFILMWLYSFLMWLYSFF